MILEVLKTKASIFSSIAYLLVIIAFFVKGRKSILWIDVVANLFCAFFFFLISRNIPMILCTLMALLNILSNFRERYKKAQILFYPIILAAIYLGMLGFNDKYDLFVILSLLFELYARYIKSEDGLRLFMVASRVPWILYFMILGRYYELTLHIAIAIACLSPYIIKYYRSRVNQL